MIHIRVHSPSVILQNGWFWLFLSFDMYKWVSFFRLHMTKTIMGEVYLVWCSWVQFHGVRREKDLLIFGQNQAKANTVCWPWLGGLLLLFLSWLVFSYRRKSRYSHFNDPQTIQCIWIKIGWNPFWRRILIFMRLHFHKIFVKHYF